MKKRIVFFTLLVAIFVACLVLPFHARAASSIRILYKCNNTSATSVQIAPWFKVYNDGPDALSLSQVTIRYWYTRDNVRPQTSVCDYAQVGTNNITGNCVAMSNPANTADYYLEVGFTAGAGTVASGSNSGEIQFRIHNDIWSDYNQANDYSFNASMTTFTENTNVTAYINGVLVYGTEPGTTSSNKFLVIVSKPLYDTGLITAALNTYLSDLSIASWEPLMIKVDNSSSSNPDYVCANPAALKTVIQTYYSQGYVGFVLIGSGPAIPTAFWRYTQDPGEMVCPTDLFYADMDAWTDYNSDGVYESYDSIDTSGNFLGANYAPEMIYGRISAGCLTSSITEEAVKVASYLNKIHNYRTYGSNLTLTQQERMLVFYDQNDFKGLREVIDSFQGLTTKINGFFDDTITTRDKLKTELENGYQFAQYATHSYAQSHAIDYWPGGVIGTEEFNLDYLNSLTPRVHYLNMYSCDACYFQSWPSGNVPNIGATYIFNNDYVLNITGSTGHWGFMPDATYWSEINLGKPIGEVLRDYFTREINRTINPEGGCPKGILLGDPTLTYSVAKVTNKMPYIRSTNLAGAREKPRVEAIVGCGFRIQATDPESDPVTVTVTGLPGGTLIGTDQVTWTPGSGDTGVFQATVTASDRPANLYQEEFSVKVWDVVGDNLLQNSGFETAMNWTADFWDPNCTIGRDSTIQRTDTYSAIVSSSVENDCRYEQLVDLAPNTNYVFSGYIRTQDVSGRATLTVEYTDNFVISSTSLSGTNSAWQFVYLTFNSGDHTSAKFQCRLGMYSDTCTGTAWYDDLSLREIIEPEEN